MDEAAASAKLNVVLFPWLAFGHMIPYLELAKRLAARGHAVTFLSTPRNVARLPPVPADLSPRVRLVALPAPVVDGLPEGAESTADVPPEKQELLKKALDGLAAPFAAFSRTPLPTTAAWIAFLGPRWAQAAHPRTTLEDFTAPPRWCPSFPSAVAYRRHEAGWAVDAFQPNASGVSDIERMWQIIERARFTIYRSCDEVEPGVFALLTDLFRKPAIPAGGPLAARPCRWRRQLPLSWQPPKSTIYVALGSEAPLTACNLHELALGLELAGVRFLWAFRKPSGMSAPTNTDVAELLPAGFEDRTRGHGLVWSGWVHRASSHGRWRSGASAWRWRGTRETARLAGDSVAAAVRSVMVEEQGKVFASNAERLKQALRDQRRQDQYMDELVGYLKRYKDDSC
ncbi:unnamed protein product [Miscanthus lutarioriparius]|uniref:Uncharacterized protein n=1 Tax=Miscanthus lutarioriparius TaxID=422564 RepID=A0A811SQQ6_9POAL|nr:unnamed protein product [Miscanthus lutarioriparius]